MAAKQPVVVEEVLQSDVLYLGEVRVSEIRGAGRLNLRSGRKLKDLLQPVLFWFLKSAPAGLALAPLRLATGIARLSYRVPGNPLRQSCEDVCTIAARQGIVHDPKETYHRFLSNLVSAAKGYQLLLRHGPDAVLDRVELAPDQLRKPLAALESHAGTIVPCPHNAGSAFAAVRMTRSVPMIAVMRNSATIRRTRLALETFERMQLRILMVRSGNPFELSRAMFAALKDRQAIAATVDNIDKSAGGVPAEIFGQEVMFSPWAAKIAAKKKVPVIPSYYRSSGERIVVEFGEPLVTGDLQEAMQHYVSYFEQKILEDPASWAYLADRKWRAALRRAAAVQSSSTT